MIELGQISDLGLTPNMQKPVLNLVERKLRFLDEPSIHPHKGGFKNQRLLVVALGHWRSLAGEPGLRTESPDVLILDVVLLLADMTFVRRSVHSRNFP